MNEGLQPDSPELPKTRSRAIADVKPCPNWSLINRSHLTDQEFLDRYRMLATVREQMIKHTRRRLIPISAWEDLVEFAILRAITTWKGNGDGRCPLKNYAWVLLRNISIQYWNKNKLGILDSIELDRGFMSPDP